MLGAINWKNCLLKMNNFYDYETWVFSSVQLGAHFKDLFQNGISIVFYIISGAMMKLIVFIGQ